MDELSTSTFYSGLSGLQVPILRYLYPPPYENASRLTYYSSLFNSIEINSSFYRIPRPATVAKWASSVPAGFTFTFKLWKEITHIKELAFKRKDVTSFFAAINTVEDKRGCLLIQFPPSLGKEYIFQLDKLLSCIRDIENNSWKIAIEFRNKSWYNESTYNLLDFFKSALVIHDIPKSVTPMINHQSEFIYVRFHGPTGNYRDSYPEDFLSEYVTYISEWISERKKVYVYFNNTMGDAYNNLRMMNSLLKNRMMLH